MVYEKFHYLLFNIFSKIKKIMVDEQRRRLNSRPNTNIDGSSRFGEYSEICIEGTPTSIYIGKGFHCRKFCNLLVFDKASLIIKENVFFNNYCSINCLGSIEIGENSLFGEGVKIYDHNHVYYREGANELKVERNKFNVGSIKIGKNCWIGSNVTILNNVEIGDNVIVGANNLIYKSVPSNVIVRANAEAIIKY